MEGASATNLDQMKIGIVTLFPEIFEPYLAQSILGRAQSLGLVQFSLANPRDFAYDRHRTVDDSPYGGFPGMLMKPEPVALAAESLGLSPEAQWLITDPVGEPLNQPLAKTLSSALEIGIICGHYEGIDERISEHFRAKKVNIGPYILTGGELPALVIADAVVRLLPGALGNEESLSHDTFSEKWEGEYSPPNFTKPAVWRGITVPTVLVSGNHADIAQWAKNQSKP